MKKVTFILLAIFVSLLQVQVQAQDWSQLGLDIDGEAAESNSGCSVSLSADGSIVAIGADGTGEVGHASGRVRVYAWMDEAWTQLGEDINGDSINDQLGWSVSLNSDGTVLAIGILGHPDNDNGSGLIRVFDWDETNWVQRGLEINGAAEDKLFGYTVSLSADGSVVAVGSPMNSGSPSDVGSVRVYSWNDTAWIQLGLDIDGEAIYSFFGNSVDLSSNGLELVVGEPGSPMEGNPGQVRMFHWDGTNWLQKGQTIESETSEFGNAVSMSDDGSLIALCSPNYYVSDGVSNIRGQVTVYSWNGTEWVQQGLDITGIEGDNFAHKACLSGDGLVLAIGALYNDNERGQVSIYYWNGTAWMQSGQGIEGETEGSWLGYSISLSYDGTIMASGAPRNSENGLATGHVRVYEEPIGGYDYLEHVGIKSVLQEDISIYPNPSKGQLSIEAEAIDFVEISNASGQLISREAVNSNKFNLDISNQAAGIYFIKLISNEETTIHKLILE